MNNFRLSSFEQTFEVLNLDQRAKIAKASPLFKHLSDGRVLDLTKNSIIATPSSSVYEVITREKNVIIFDTLKEVLDEVGVGFRTLKKQLDLSDVVEYRGFVIKRIPVFSELTRMRD